MADSAILPAHDRMANAIRAFDATGREPVDKWTAAPRLTASPQANNISRSNQLIWCIDRSTQNVPDIAREAAKSVSTSGGLRRTVPVARLRGDRTLAGDVAGFPESVPA